MSLVRDLKRDYGDFRIDIPRWDIADRGITVLWGPSGAGKTTVFQMLIGLEECPEMSWEFQGEDLARLSVEQRRLGVVFQDLGLFPHMTAEQNIIFAARARNIGQAREKMELLARSLKINGILKKTAAKISGGEAQRVALARALIGEPRMLLLDEPFSALDVEIRKEARQLVRQVIRESHVPALLITHDPEDIEALADQTVRIENGRIVGS